MKIRGVYIFALMLLLIGCETTDHEGFKRHQDSVHFKLLTVGDENNAIDNSKYVSLTVVLQDNEANELAVKNIERVPFERATWPTVVKSFLAGRGAGESLLIRGEPNALSVAEWFSPMPLDTTLPWYDLQIEIREVFNDAQLRQIRAEERLAKDKELVGLKWMEKALDSLKFDENEFISGIYFRELAAGNGASPKSGSMVKVHYRAYRCDGRIIDDTYRTEPFEYPIGKPDQVIPGFAVAISQMRAGGKAIFLIPPDLAYGAKGSSSGIVPPYEAVIYEAHLLYVR